MVSVTVSFCPRKSCHQHIGTKGTNHTNHVAQRYIVSAPLRERLFRALRKSEIRYPRKALLHTVVLVRSQQFLSPQHAQHIRQIAANLVLTALAAIQRHQQCAHSPPSRLQRQHAAVFVVGMRHGLHQPRRRTQPQYREPQAGYTLVLRNFRWNTLIEQSGRVR